MLETFLDDLSCSSFSRKYVFYKEFPYMYETEKSRIIMIW